MDWSKLNIPFIIEKVVGNIIDSLNCEDIIILKQASVIGTIFDLDKLNKLNIINSLTYEGLKQKINKFEELGLIEILYDLDPKKIVVKFSIPFLKEILYKRMLVETKNEIHLKVARFMGDSKFSYLPRKIERKLINHHLIEEEKTIQDHLVDTEDVKVEEIVKEANQKIKFLKETIDTVKDIDTRTQDTQEIDKKLSLMDKEFEVEEKMKNLEKKKANKEEEYQEENTLISNKNIPKVKGGFIEKKSDKGITWEKRFVIVTKTRFYYWYRFIDYKSNKLYLGMFDLKNIYLIKKIKKIKDYEFGQKKNLLQLKVSSFFKKDRAKGGRDYFFSFRTPSELNSWFITLNLLRAKSIYDEFRNTFGVINFPFNHEKIIKEDKRRLKRTFNLPDINNYTKRKSRCNYLQTSKIINNVRNDKKRSVKLSDKLENDWFIFNERRTLIENNYSLKLKERIEYLYTVTLGYIFGVLQHNISLNTSDKNNNNFIIGEPHHLVEAIKNSKNYKKMIEEQETSKNEVKEIIKSNIGISNNIIPIEGGTPLPFVSFKENSKKENNGTEQSSINDVVKNKKKSLIPPSLKNYVKDESNFIDNDISEMSELINVDNLLNCSEIETEVKKERNKKLSFISEIDIDPKDRLKDLDIEINSKELEEQIQELMKIKEQ